MHLECLTGMAHFVKERIIMMAIQENPSLISNRSILFVVHIIQCCTPHCHSRCIYALYSEAGEFLVRHWRSRILSKPRPRTQDETLGAVNMHLDHSFLPLRLLNYRIASIISRSALYVILCPPAALSWRQPSTSTSQTTALLATSWKRCLVSASSAHRCSTRTWRTWDWCQTYTARYACVGTQSTQIRCADVSAVYTYCVFSVPSVGDT